MKKKKDKHLQVTKEQLKQIKSTKSIGEVMYLHYGKYRSFRVVDEYFVPYHMVRTEDLILMMRRLTIYQGSLGRVDVPTGNQNERIKYLKELNEYLGFNVSEKEFDECQTLIRNQEFLSNSDDYFKRIKQELSIREHVPNKIERKKIRKLKATGRYIID